MRKQSPPANLKKSWISAHPRLVIGLILLVCLGPFLNKAIHADDVLFVWTGQWIQKHPADFFGLKVNWWSSAIPMWVANYNPPLMSYFLAGVASLFGWHEIVLHLAGLTVAVTAAMGIYSLAQMWCQRPLLATLIAIFTPAFLVSSTTLMCDVPMLAFWIWTLALWERALVKKQSRWQFLGAGTLAGLAVLTKYSAITLLPLLLVLTLLRTRKPGWWLLGLAVPLFMLAGYELITARMYGRGLFSAAVHYAHTTHIEFPGGWKANAVIGLAFAGGSLLPLLFYAPFLWRPMTLLAAGVVILGLWLGMVHQGSNLGLMLPWANPELMNDRNFVLQVMLLTAGGLHLLLLVVAETWRRRDPVTIILALWIVGVLYFVTVLNWTINVRSFLPLVPATAILLMRRLEASRGNFMMNNWRLGPLIPAAAIALSVAAADYQLANSARTAAEQIAAKYKSANHQLWFEDHGAFQYYMEQFGGQSIDVERSLLQPEDVIVVQEFGIVNPLPPGTVGWIEHWQYAPSSWMNLMGTTASGAAGFYAANFGPIPFAIGNLPHQEYDLVKVFSRVQFNTQPANPQGVLTGDLPSFPNFSSSIGDNLNLQVNPESMTQVQLARRFEQEGKTEEAIRLYRQALAMDPNNVFALNNLASILATDRRYELRNGEEAVRLATKAVQLTDSRIPALFGTLAAAYTQAGQFPEAAMMDKTARAFARLTGQDITDKNALWKMFSSD